MCAATVRVETLMALEPIASLSEARLRELAGLCRMERVSRNSDPFLERGIAGQTVYLVKGELALAYPDGSSTVLSGGSDQARTPLGRRGAMFTGARAVTDVELVRIDDELLDMIVTWDQLATPKPPARRETNEGGQSPLADWSILSGMFSVNNLKYGAFSQLPSAHIDELLRRFKRIDVKKGNAFGLLEKGREYVLYCQSERRSAAATFLLAQRGYRAFLLAGGLWGDAKGGK